MLTSRDSYVLAAVKFSICSKVEIQDPRFIKYLTFVKDHLAIANDLASYDKESRDFVSGASKDIINIVDVFQHIMSLPHAESAKVMAYTYQLQTETWMVEELQRLRSEEELDNEQWQYLEATYVCAAGNTFFSMTSSRYGGEAARLQASSRSDGKTPSALTKKHLRDTEMEERASKLPRML